MDTREGNIGATGGYAGAAHVLPPAVRLMHLIAGKWVARSVSIIAEMGVADLLAEGPCEVDALASKLSLNADALYRVLRALTVVELFVELPGRRFALSPLSELLRAGVPGSLRAAACLTSEPVTWRAWSELEHSLKTGTPAFDKFYGKSVFGYFAEDPSRAAAFNVGMSELMKGELQPVVRGYDFSGIKRLVDVGGGLGLLVSSIVERYPSIQGVLFDLAEIVAAAGAPPSIERVGGSFFEAIPGADAYILKHVVHNWDDESCVKILGNCRAAMSPGGRVLVVEGLIDDSPLSAGTKFNDLEMLVMTHGGRERTEAEMAAIFEKAGLKLTRVVPTESPVYVLEGRAP